MYLLARISKAQRILEIGTLGGYSTIWLARALPKNGRLITLEANPVHADIACQNIKNANLSDIVDIRLGAALETLPQLEKESTEAFDLVFIDADKPNNSNYLVWALKLSKPGTIIIADNVVRNGAVLDTENSDPNVQGIRQFTDLVAANPKLTATVVQTVGAKGHDGFMMMVVN